MFVSLYFTFIIGRHNCHKAMPQLFKSLFKTNFPHITIWARLCYQLKFNAITTPSALGGHPPLPPPAAGAIPNIL
jgi:hypothetical protein